MRDENGDIIYCALCEAEAMTRTKVETPLCSTYSEAYELGVRAKEDVVSELLAACKCAELDLYDFVGGGVDGFGC